MSLDSYIAVPVFGSTRYGNCSLPPRSRTISAEARAALRARVASWPRDRARSAPRAPCGSTDSPRTRRARAASRGVRPSVFDAQTAAEASERGARATSRRRGCDSWGSPWVPQRRCGVSLSERGELVDHRGDRGVDAFACAAPASVPARRRDAPRHARRSLPVLGVEHVDQERAALVARHRLRHQRDARRVGDRLGVDRLLDRRRSR